MTCADTRAIFRQIRYSLCPIITETGLDDHIANHLRCHCISNEHLQQFKEGIYPMKSQKSLSMLPLLVRSHSGIHVTYLQQTCIIGVPLDWLPRAIPGKDAAIICECQRVLEAHWRLDSKNNWMFRFNGKWVIPYSFFFVRSRLLYTLLGWFRWLRHGPLAAVPWIRINISVPYELTWILVPHKSRLKIVSIVTYMKISLPRET